MDNEIVLFTNNLSEKYTRITKVQQKISGCLRSEEGAHFFVGYEVIFPLAVNRISDR